MPVWTSTDPPAELNETPLSKLTEPVLVDLVKVPWLLNELAVPCPVRRDRWFRPGMNRGC